MKQFEYKVVSVSLNLPVGKKGYEKAASEFEIQLNKLGAEGWELVQRIDGFFFSKEKYQLCKFQFNEENIINYEKTYK